MNVNAVVSGQAGVALLVNGPELASIHAGRSGEIVRRNLAESRFLLGDAGDLQFLENIEIDEVIRRLERASAQVDALHAVLILLDGSLESETRQIAAEELQELMEDAAVSSFVESVLFAYPLTRDSDLPGALSVCTAQTEQTRSFLLRLSSLQGAIGEVHRAWEWIATPVFGKEENRTEARSVAVREELFREMVLSCFREEPLERVLFKGLSSARFRKVGNYEIILGEWIVALQERSKAFRRESFAAELFSEGSRQELHLLVPRHSERLSVNMGTRFNFLTLETRDKLNSILCIEGKRVASYWLSSFLELDVPKALAILGVLGREGVCHNRLMIFHRCDPKTPVDSIPFGVGYPRVPWVCRNCGEIVGSLSDLLFELEAVIIRPADLL